MSKASLVDSILQGAFDLRVHAAPDQQVERRFDALDTARYAHEHQLAGFALVSDSYMTAPMAQALSRIYPGLTVVGAIVLNEAAGGLDPAAVRSAVDLGAKIVSMPTRGVVPICDANGELFAEVRAILEIVRTSGATLTSGGISNTDALALCFAAKRLGIDRFVLSGIESMGVEQLEAAAEHGAYIEAPFIQCLPTFGDYVPFVSDAIASVGPERCIVTTGMGRWQDPPPAEGLRMAIGWLLERGFPAEQVTSMVKTNPRRLAGLD